MATLIVERDKEFPAENFKEKTYEYCRLLKDPEFPAIFSKGTALTELYIIFQNQNILDKKADVSSFGSDHRFKS